MPVFPDATGRWAKQYNGSNSIDIFFDETTMVNMVEIEEKVYDGSYTLAFLDRYSYHFIDIHSFSTNSSGNLTQLMMNPPIFASAIRIGTSGRSSSAALNTTIATLGINGCPGVSRKSIIENEPELEWKIDISRRELLTYPFLDVGEKHN